MTKNSTNLARSLIVLAALLAFAPFTWANQGLPPNDWRCSLAGTWIGENDAGVVFIITITPLDNAHRRFSTVGDAAANHPSGGVFVTAVEGTAFRGEARRSGPRAFQQTAISYVRDDLSWIGTFAVSGTWNLDEDCQTAEVVWYGGVFAPDQDPFADLPMFCFPPISGTYHRVPVVRSACEP